MYSLSHLSKYCCGKQLRTVMNCRLTSIKPVLVRTKVNQVSDSPLAVSSSPGYQQASETQERNKIKKKEKQKKELVINTKYDKCSDPVYHHLLYSTELDVFQTVKRGKIWMERVYAKKMAVARELQERHLSSTKEAVPVALEYLYGGSNVVQRSDKQEEEIFEAKTSPLTENMDGTEKYDYDELFEKTGTEIRKSEYPYSVYKDVNEPLLKLEDTQNTASDTAENGAICSRGRRGRGSMRQRGRTMEIPQKENLVGKVAEFDVIGNDFLNPDIRKVFSDDYLFKYGTPNADMESTGIPCGGCGAELNAKDEKMPGYLPSEIIESKSKNQEELRATLCQRCYFIKEYNIALKVNVAPEDYPKTIEHLKDKEALIILVVDLTDFPGSVWPNILDLLGKNKKILLVGNKLDLILPDQRHYIKNITEVMHREFLSKCSSSEEGGHVFPNLVSAMCVSARTGHNIEVLVDKIFRYWRWNNNCLPGDVYIVGCTNVGKSSIFNTLISSDLCKIKATEIVSHAMTSPVPGTTLNLLKFPVTRPEPHFINDRSRRLSQFKSAYIAEEKERLVKLQKYKKTDYAIPSHFSVTHTIKLALRERTPKTSSYLPAMELKEKEDLPEVMDPESTYFKRGKWCYDTPGTVSTDQIINTLTAEEIDKTLPMSPLIPRTILLKQGHSLLLGGIARLDFVSGEKPDGTPKFELEPVHVTVFCSAKLPVSVLETVGVQDFLSNPLAWKLTQVPSGTLERMREFPKLLGKEFSTEGRIWNIGCADIVMSSAGWAMITAPKGEKSNFVAYTPGGKGLSVRNPFLPYSINQRGKRILGSPTYRNDQLYLKHVELFG